MNAARPRDPGDGEVWSASTYVTELRRRRDEALEVAQLAVRPEPVLARAAVYEECALLCELSSDRRAWRPVFDALHRLVRGARLLDAQVDAAHFQGEEFRARVEDVADAVRAVDAALAARTTLPEVLEVPGRELERCDPPVSLGISCGDGLILRRYDPDAFPDPWDPDGRNTRPPGGKFR